MEEGTAEPKTMHDLNASDDEEDPDHPHESAEHRGALK